MLFIFMVFVLMEMWRERERWNYRKRRKTEIGRDINTVYCRSERIAY
jgi:hypothetical protein